MRFRNALLAGCVCLAGCLDDGSDGVRNHPLDPHPSYGSLNLVTTFDRPRSIVEYRVRFNGEILPDTLVWEPDVPTVAINSDAILVGDHVVTIYDKDGLIQPHTQLVSVAEGTVTDISVELETNFPNDTEWGVGSGAPVRKDEISSALQDLVVQPPHAIELPDYYWASVVFDWCPVLIAEHDGPELAFEITGLDPDRPLEEQILVSGGFAHPNEIILEDISLEGDSTVLVDLQALSCYRRFIRIRSITYPAVPHRVISKIRAVR